MVTTTSHTTSQHPKTTSVATPDFDSTTTSTKTTSKHTTRTTTPHRPVTTTTNYVTAAPNDPHKNSATAIGVAVGVIIVMIVIAVSIVTVRRRNIQIPGVEAVRGLINPGYNRLDNTGMVVFIKSKIYIHCLL